MPCHNQLISFDCRLSVRFLTDRVVTPQKEGAPASTNWSPWPHVACLRAVVGKDEAVRVHLVEIAIGILRADPKEDVTPARAWAIDVIEKNSGVKVPARRSRGAAAQANTCGLGSEFLGPEFLGAAARPTADGSFQGSLRATPPRPRPCRGPARTPGPPSRARRTIASAS